MVEHSAGGSRVRLACGLPVGRAAGVSLRVQQGPGFLPKIVLLVYLLAKAGIKCQKVCQECKQGAKGRGKATGQGKCDQ